MARVLALVSAALAVLIGVEAGAAVASGDALRNAAAHAANGDYPAAIALDRAVARQSGPIRLLDGDVVARADASLPALTDGWAVSLANAGQVGQGLAVLENAPDASSTHLRGQLLLSAARDAAAAGDPAVALRRLDLLSGTLGPTDPVMTAAAQLRPGYTLAAARALITSGHAAEAVTQLNATIAADTASAVSNQARLLLPSTLLAAGQQALAAQADQEALDILNTLVNDFPNSSSAATARHLLATPQTVVGTLAHRDGTAISGKVRLSTKFRRLGSSYLTSGPFYSGVADSSGDLTVSAVPLGGPYVLEVYGGNGWTTLIDPATGGPADPVTVVALTPSDLGYIVVPS